MFLCQSVGRLFAQKFLKKMVPVFALMFWSMIVGSGEAFVFSPRSFNPRRCLASRAQLSMDGKVSQLQPMSNFILVKLKEVSEQSIGGIVLIESDKWKPMEGTVISCGTGNFRDRDGKTVVGGSMPKAGDNILFAGGSGAEIKDLSPGSKHLLISNEHVMLIQSPEDSVMTLNNVRPAHDRLLLKTETIKETTAGGIYIPQSSSEEDIIEGKVLAVGEGCNESPRLSPTPVVQGECVLFNKHHGVKVKIQGEEYTVLGVDSCLAKC